MSNPIQRATSDLTDTIFLANVTSVSLSSREFDHENPEPHPAIPQKNEVGDKEAFKRVQLVLSPCLWRVPEPLSVFSEPCVSSVFGLASIEYRVLFLLLVFLCDLSVYPLTLVQLASNQSFSISPPKIESRRSHPRKKPGKEAENIDHIKTIHFWASSNST